MTLRHGGYRAAYAIPAIGRQVPAESQSIGIASVRVHGSRHVRVA
jgi:hypothetical protein